MRIICIELIDGYTFNPKLNEICEVEIDYALRKKASTEPEGKITHYLIKDVLNKYYYPSSCFISLDEYRNKQIDLIIN